MRVRCTTNRVSKIFPELVRRHVEENVHLDEVALTPGAEYEVLGLVFWDGYPWFYISECAEADYPTPYSRAFFSVEDPRVGSDWVFAEEGGCPALLPRWWAGEPRFFERLVDGEATAVEIFRNRYPSGSPVTGAGN